MVVRIMVVNTGGITITRLVKTGTVTFKTGTITFTKISPVKTGTIPRIKSFHLVIGTTVIQLTWKMPRKTWISRIGGPQPDNTKWAQCCCIEKYGGRLFCPCLCTEYAPHLSCWYWLKCYHSSKGLAWWLAPGYSPKFGTCKYKISDC